MCDCGRPKFECRNEANNGLYEVADVTCYAHAAVEEHTSQQGFKPDPGQRFYATEIDEELITRRTFGRRVDADEIPDTYGHQTGNEDDKTDR